MPFPYDDNFEEDSGVFHEDERPTVAEGRRRKRRELAQDPDYRFGRIVAEVVRLRSDVDRLLSLSETVPPPRTRASIRPQVAQAGIAATVSATVMGIFQILRATGVIK